MKKYILFITILLSIVALSACQRDEEVLRVGMDLRYAPFEMLNGENEPDGISVDIAYALGAFLGREVEIVNTNFASLIPSLQSGEIDITIASMSITEARKTNVDFSEPYFYFKIISLVNKDFALANGLTEDSTVEDILAIENIRFIGIASQVSATIPESLGKDVIEATDLGTAVLTVSQGTADILLMSANPVVDGNKAYPTTTMVNWSSFSSSPIGMAVKKGNTELVEQANAFIATMNQTGGLYEILAEKYDDIIIASLGRFGLSFYINE